MEPRSTYILAILIFSITESVAGAFFGRPMDKIPEGFRLIRVGNRYVLVRIESKSTSSSGLPTNHPHPEPKPDLERCWPPGHCNGVPVIDPSATKQLKTTTEKFTGTFSHKVEPTKKVSKTTGHWKPISKATKPTERPAWARGAISTAGTNVRHSLSTNGIRGANGRRKMDQADAPSSLTENETAAISAAVVFGVALVVIIVVLVILLKKRNKKEATNVSNPGYDAPNTFYAIGAPPNEHQYMHIAENNNGSVRPPPHTAPERISHIYETLPDSAVSTNRPPQVYQGLMTHNDSCSSLGSSRNSPELDRTIEYAVSPLDYPRRHVPSRNQYLDTPRNMGISSTNYQGPQRDVPENYDCRHQMPVNNKEQQVAVIGRSHAPHIYHVLEV